MQYNLKKKLVKQVYNCEDEYQSEGAYNFANGPMSLKDSIWNQHLSKREIVINQEIDDSIIEKAVLQIWNINNYDHEQDMNREAIGAPPSNREPIIVMINTMGGSIDEAFSLISAIESSVTPIVTMGLGKCWSAGFLILLAGHHRVVQKHTSMMYHQGSGGYIGPIGQHIEYVDYFKKIQERVELYVKEKTKVSQGRLEEVFNRKQDWFLYPEEALEYGIIDDIISSVNEEETEEKPKEDKPAKKERKPRTIKEKQEPIKKSRRQKEA